jgi:serine/threonine protein phosphatase 1
MCTLAIGDIHGCHTALSRLLEEVRPAAGDFIVFLGDYIDRGRASKSVLDWMAQGDRKYSTVFLRGNHEVMILEARDDPSKANLWMSYGGLETLASYSAEFATDWAAIITPRHWGFLEGTIPFFETETHIFVHACLDPDLDMAEQPPRLLFWESFDRIKPHKSRKKIICGHSPQRAGEIRDLGFAACIDTGAAVGGWFTCLDIESGYYWQATEQGKIRAGLLRENSG